MAAAVTAAVTVAVCNIVTMADEKPLLSPPTRESVLKQQSDAIKLAVQQAAAEDRREARQNRVAFLLIIVVLIGIWRMLQQPVGPSPLDEGTPEMASRAP